MNRGTKFNLKEINERKEEGLIVGIDCVVRNIKEVNTTGRSFYQTLVTIEDLTDKMTFSIFENINEVSQKFKEGRMYTLYGTTHIWSDKAQIRLSSYESIEETEENRSRLDINHFRRFTEEQEKALGIIINEKIENEKYRRLVQVVLGLGDVPAGVDEEEYRDRYKSFKEGWAAENHHDNYSGGLANHVVGICRIILSMKNIYGIPKGRVEARAGVNWDHLLALAIIHDIDKLQDYVYDKYSCKWNKERNYDHQIGSVITLSLRHAEVEKDLQLSNEELEALKYGILCHHGKWSNYEMLSVEDRIFHSCDCLDAAFVDSLELF